MRDRLIDRRAGSNVPSHHVLSVCPFAIVSQGRVSRVHDSVVASDRRRGGHDRTLNVEFLLEVGKLVRESLFKQCFAVHFED